MSRVQHKRDTESVVKSATLLPGEISVATDTGDVFVGKPDGSKTDTIQPTDLLDALDTNDQPVEIVELDAGSVGPLKLNETDITLADGSSFSERNLAGELTGQMGKKGNIGVKGSAGDAGPDGKNGRNSYDVVIRTQAEFDALVASPTWLDAKSVAFIGDGGTLQFNNENDDTLIPATVKQVHGYANAIIRSYAFGYNAVPDGAGYSMVGITTVGDSGMSGFQYCENMLNCTFISDGGAGYQSHGFLSCTNLINCSVISSADSSKGFVECQRLINCQAIMTNYGPTGYSKCSDLQNCKASYGWIDIGCGFEECSNLNNCESMTRNYEGSSSGEGNSYGFRNCKMLLNCIGYINIDASTVAVIKAYGFYKCENLTNCTGTGYIRGVGGSEVGVGSEGYSFYGCSYMNGCNEKPVNGDSGLLSPSGFLGGNCTKVDTLTVVSGYEGR